MQAKFLEYENALIVCPADANVWILHAPFYFKCQLGGKEHRVEAPPRFITDFASIPRVFWALAPRWGDYGWAAVIHDFLYWDQQITRRHADDLFLDAMRRSKVPAWRSHVVYWAVRAFGNRAWQHNAVLKVNKPRARIQDAGLPDPFHFKEWTDNYRATVQSGIR